MRISLPTEWLATGLCATTVFMLAAMPAGQSADAGATVTLADAKGQSIGTAQLTETQAGVLVTLSLTAAPAGAHALHFHQTGRCDAPSFESAGPHFNPSEAKHGFKAQGGPHAGDLPNVHVPKEGRLQSEILVHGLTLRAGPASLLDMDGAALVLHESADDYMSDPAGNAGDRAACGVVKR